MSDEAPIEETITTRVDRINEAVRKLSALAYVQIVDGGRPKSDAEQIEIVDTIQALGVLVGTIIVSLSEIADSVGKLVKQGEQDFSAAVDAAAEVKASVKHDEANKRNFIGKR